MVEIKIKQNLLWQVLWLSSMPCFALNCWQTYLRSKYLHSLLEIIKSEIYDVYYCIFYSLKYGQLLNNYIKFFIGFNFVNNNFYQHGVQSGWKIFHWIIHCVIILNRLIICHRILERTYEHEEFNFSFPDRWAFILHLKTSRV